MIGKGSVGWGGLIIQWVLLDTIGAGISVRRVGNMLSIVDVEATFFLCLFGLYLLLDGHV